MSKEEERLYGVSAFHVGEKRYTPRNSIFFDKSVVFTDGYGKITKATNKEHIIHLSLPDSIEGISIDEIGESAFSDSMNLEVAMLPSSIEVIGKKAFFNCKKLRVLSIGSSIYDIGESAFESCENLESIFLPFSLEKIGTRAFYGCNNLRNIKFSRDIELGAMCFASCASLEFVECQGLKIIPDGAFMTSGVKRIYLSNAIEHIGISAFSSCKSLEAIYYDGSLEEFRKISFGINWNKNIPRECALYIRNSHGQYYDAFKDNGKEENAVKDSNKDNPFDSDLSLFGIDEKNPTLATIARAYREKVRKFHPDVLSGLNLDSAYTEFASKRFREYTEAYERLVKRFK